MNSIEKFFKNYVYMRPRAVIPKITLSEILGGNSSIQLEELNVANGNVSIIELLCLVSLVKKYNPKRLFEIGTFDGRTTLNIAQNAPADAKVYTLDLLKEKKDQTALYMASAEKKFIDKDTVGQRYAGKDAGKITQLYGDSANFDYSPFLNSIDFIFVDGAHSYEYVVSDSQNALKLLRGKGIIVWHDYDTIYRGGRGLTRALNELYRKKMKEMKRIEGTSLVFLLRE